MIIGISGKIGTGKTTLAQILQRYFSFPFITAFGDPLKDETAEVLQLNRHLLNTEEGKDTALPMDAVARLCALLEMPIPGEAAWTYRDALQKYGTDYRRMKCGTPNYWVDATATRIAERKKRNHTDGVIIHDVRFVNEADWLRSQESVLVRINPYDGWKPGPKAGHISETALDTYMYWDLAFSPGFGQQKQIAECIMAYAVLCTKACTFMRIPKHAFGKTHD